MTSSTTDFQTAGFLTTARRVIAREAEALAMLGQVLDGSFSDAVGMILAAKGRVIVSGMGKSGHIARKIAATLASTGTPAHFVHPAEASHGDLGMITKGDVALVLSNSGETPELADIVAHTRRFGIPLIGVASKADSTLMRQSEVAILLPDAPEACETGVVPTTSTTMMLALGDALAIALMEHRAFTPDHFRLFHPGGKLGAKLLKVRDLMHDAVPLIDAARPMSEALLTISAKGFGVVGVTQGEALCGIITDGDLRRLVEQGRDLRPLTAREVMHQNPTTISEHALAVDAADMMEAQRITSVLVVDAHGALCGALNSNDLMRAKVI